MSWVDWLQNDRGLDLAIGGLAALGTALSFILREWLKKQDADSSRALSREELFIKHLMERIDRVNQTVVERETRIDALEEKVDSTREELESEREIRFTLRNELQTELLKAGEIQELFHALFNDGPLGIALVDRDLIYKVVNTKLCAMLGRTEKELLGQEASQFLAPAEREKGIAFATKALHGPFGLRYVRGTVFLRPDGSTLPVRIWVLRVNADQDRGLMVLADAEE